MNAEIDLLRFDELALKKHVDLERHDVCFSWREYTPGVGYDHSVTNQLIRNFQIPVLEHHRKHYKEQAIKQIASEFIHVIANESIYEKFTFVPIPPSKPFNHPEYDDRLIKLLGEVSKLKKIEMDVRSLITQNVETKSSKASESHERLSLDELLQIYTLNENLLNTPIPSRIIVFDDVLTKGTHFKAAQKILQSVYKNVPIIGLFIAQAVYADA